MCVKVHQLLRSGIFGDCSEALKAYEHRCHELFPLAVMFRPLPSLSLANPSEGGPNEPSSENPPGGQENVKSECSGGQG